MNQSSKFLPSGKSGGPPISLPFGVLDWACEKVRRLPTDPNKTPK